MHFNKETLGVTKDEFIEKVLKPLNPKKIFVGTDYRFGTGGEGDAKYLKNFFDVEVVELEKIDNIKISSKKIREYIENGKMEKAASLLGRPYRICGLVVEGQHNGQKLGFPTANLELDYPYVFPKEGVYMGYGYFMNRRRKAMISVGTHPTINQLLKPIIEVHIIDFNENLYGRELYVDFISYMRANKQFDSLDDLRDQLIKDEEKTKNTLQ
jgi:riboflavin kinase/FMN adenylyltransferase